MWSQNGLNFLGRDGGMVGQCMARILVGGGTAAMINAMNSGRSRLIGGYDLDRSTDLPKSPFQGICTPMRLRRFSVRDDLHWLSYAPQAHKAAVLGQIPGEAAPTQYNDQVPSIAPGPGACLFKHENLFCF